MLPPHASVTTSIKMAFVSSGTVLSAPEVDDLEPGAGRKRLLASRCSLADSYSGFRISSMTKGESDKKVRRTLKTERPTSTPSAKKMKAITSQMTPQTKLQRPSLSREVSRRSF